MQNLKLKELLQCLPPAEFKRFGEFIRSPFYNRNPKLISLYKFFESSFTNSSIKNVTRESMWDNIFPGQEYNDLKMRSLLSSFRKLIVKYIIVIDSEKKDGNQKNILLNGLNERNMIKNYQSVCNEILSGLTQEFNMNSDYYYNKLNFERSVLVHEGKNIEVNLDNKYFKLSDNIDYFFITTKLELINSLLSRKYHVLGNIKVNILFAEEIISYIEQNINQIRKENPIIYSEYLILMMMTNSGNDRYFFELHHFVLKNINKYNIYELEQVYYPLINYGFNKVAMGENEYLYNIFEIYKTFERKGFYLEKKIFQDIDFISIIIIGLRLKKIAWVERFYSNYKIKLMPECMEDTTNLAKAIISYHTKNYEVAINLLGKVNYQNSYYYLKSKETMMQIYYEKKDYELLESLIDATKHYLKRRQGILSIHYERYLLFLRFVNVLLKARLKDKNEIAILKKELSVHKNAIARDWLLEKVKELEYDK